jgi:hypothetical protein
VVEDADRTAASGEDAATVDGVHFKAVTGIGRVSDKRAAGRPGEFKGEGIGVCVVAHSAMMSATRRPSC